MHVCNMHVYVNVSDLSSIFTQEDVDFKMLQMFFSFSFNIVVKNISKMHRCLAATIL